jgi:hypothetical protein
MHPTTTLFPPTWLLMRLLGRKNVTVADGSKFKADFPVEIKDSAHSEWGEIEAS